MAGKLDQAMSKITYREFVGFMNRYKREIELKEKKEKHKSPYKYVSIFNKDKKNES